MLTALFRESRWLISTVPHGRDNTKALIREKGETVLESDNVPGIDWDTGYPLTAPGWAGGSYILVNDFVQTADEDFVEFEISARGSGEEHFNEETVTIDGKEYTRAELLAILDQTH